MKEKCTGGWSFYESPALGKRLACAMACWTSGPVDGIDRMNCCCAGVIPAAAARRGFFCRPLSRTRRISLVTSFLLIGFWYHKPSAVAAAKKAFLMTRVGDVGLFIGLILLFQQD